MNASSARRHLVRYGVAYVIACAWVASSLAFPSDALTTTRSAGIGAAGGSGPLGTDGSVIPPSEGSAPGAGPAAPTTTLGSAGGPGQPARGTSKAGVACGPGVGAMPGNSYSGPCVPAWSGDNGGATAKGVTAETIRIVRRKFPEDAFTQGFDAISNQAGFATAAQTEAVFQVFLKEFARTYELYGRRVEFVEYTSRYGDAAAEQQGRGREGACLDAEVIANELHAFGALSRPGSVSAPFAECLAQRGVVAFETNLGSDAAHAALHPYAWSSSTNATLACERRAAILEDYLRKRLVGRAARFASDAATISRTRKFGYYGGAGVADPGCTNRMIAAMTSAAGSAPSTYRNTIDLARVSDEAARGVIQMKRDGVTTVLCDCDVLSLSFLTQAASSQGYHPEWLIAGGGAVDIDVGMRLLDQDQADRHVFGFSILGEFGDYSGSTGEPGRLYSRLTGGATIPSATTGGLEILSNIYNLLQAAGPHLTPESLAAGARTLPELGAPTYWAGAWSYADGDHVAVDDVREIYWDARARNPVDGKAGRYLSTYPGRRFRAGGWPAEEPPIPSR